MVAPLIGLLLLFVLGLPIFAASHARRGKPQTERIQKAGGTFLINTWLMEYGYWFMSVPANGFVHAMVWDGLAATNTIQALQGTSAALTVTISGVEVT